jgi:shikimate kinase
VACGGGVVLEPANRITLRNTGVCVFIDVPLEQLRARIHGRRTSADPRRRDWAPPGRA